jgi:hypothetical protein
VLVFGEESTEAETSLKYDHTVDVPDSPFVAVPDANPFAASVTRSTRRRR